jgi:hypothetical protein
MRANTGLLGWAIFFIVTGGLVLAVNEGLLERELLGEAWRLWPLILIGIGMGLLLRDSPAGVLGGFLVAAVFGAMAAAALTGGLGGIAGCGDTETRDGKPFTTAGELHPGEGVTVDFACGDLNVSTASGTGWALEGREPTDRQPRVEQGTSRLRLAAPSDGGASLPFVGNGRRVWRLTLPADLGLDDVRLSISAGNANVDLDGLTAARLVVTTNAADARLDLSGAVLDRLELDANAASTKVELPEAGLTAGSIEVNAGDVALCLPDGVAIELKADGALSDTDFSDDGLARSGDRWRSPDFDTADTRVVLSVDANAATVEVDSAQACE